MKQDLCEAGVTMKQEFHVSSLVVLTQPSLRHQLADEIATLEGAEIHAVSDEGKLVVTLEAPHAREILDCVSQIELLDGVINASLVYQHVENWQSLNQEVTHD